MVFLELIIPFQNVMTRKVHDKRGVDGEKCELMALIIMVIGFNLKMIS